VTERLGRDAVERVKQHAPCCSTPERHIQHIAQFGCVPRWCLVCLDEWPCAPSLLLADQERLRGLIGELDFGREERNSRRWDSAMDSLEAEARAIREEEGR
jgi:hypothetical protein